MRYRLLDTLARPLLFVLDPQRAHEWAVKALEKFPLPRAPPDNPRLRVSAFGLDFPNPLGLAAGFDKNGEVIDAILRLGFGFAEVGTITPLAQAGNPGPRLFRLDRDQAVINRLGFCGDGHANVHARLTKRAQRPGTVGINIGANADSSDRPADYVRGVEAFGSCARARRAGHRDGTVWPQAGAFEDRARSYARRARRHRQMRKVAENRRTHCLEYYRLAARDFARPLG
jgi:dihydroorotate dehydrogenase